MTDRIEKQIHINAPVDRVWRAISDHREFGTWFKVALDGPFVVGEKTTGKITYPGYEGLPFTAEVKRIEAPRLLAFTWVPNAVDPAEDYSGEPQTLVEFKLEPSGDGTRLTVIESGFDAIDPSRRDEAMRSNEGGWAQQVENIRAHVEGAHAHV